MKVIFKYDKQKDIWCLMNYGKGSNNSQMATKVYLKMLEKFGIEIDEEKVNVFIDEYVSENNIGINRFLLEYQESWDNVSEKFIKKTEEIFGITLNDDVTVYLSINNRSPYNIKENYFFCSMPSYMRKTVMHELWHFYTWYKFGVKKKTSKNFGRK